MKKFFSFLICLLVFAPLMFVLTSCGEVQTYSIEVRSSDSSYGSVNAVDGTYNEGSSLTLRATPILDSKFLCWALDGTVVSKQPEYSIKISKETQGRYIAIFDKGCQFYVVTKVEYDNVVESLQSLEQLETKIEVGPSITNTQTVFSSKLSPSVKSQKYDYEDTKALFKSAKLVEWDISKQDDYCKVTITMTPRGENPIIQTYYDDSVSISTLFRENEKEFEFFKNENQIVKVTFSKLNENIVNKIY